MFTKCGLTCAAFAFIFCIQAVLGDLFTSVHDMKALAHQEQKLVTNLQNYISFQQENIILLNKKLEYLKKFRPQDQTVEELVGDPINAYSLVRRLTREWPLILNLMMYNIGMQDELSRLPNEEDLLSAVRGLARLQYVYKLDINKLIHGTGRPVNLTVLDCIEMGKFQIKEKKYEIAALWFEEALSINYHKENLLWENKILPYLFLATFFAGCRNETTSERATEVLHYFMAEYPNYTLDKEFSSLFRQALSSGCSGPESLTEPERGGYSNEDLYSAACRGIGLIDQSDLRCFYIHYNNPRLLIAPFKMEEKNIDPPILMFHDVISDEEVEEMKEAFGKVKQYCRLGRIVNGTNTGYKYNYHRTCETGWVEDHFTDAAARLTRRVGDMTNLDVKTSESNHVTSYGLAGEFMPHHDFLPGGSFPNASNGNRMATLMFYLNDVEEGGFTVFPRVNVAVKPMKGSAVFWFNIDHQSEKLATVFHGGCPVLWGSKWVLNMWIHEGEQNHLHQFCPSDKQFPKPRYYMNGMKH